MRGLVAATSRMYSTLTLDCSASVGSKCVLECDRARRKLPRRRSLCCGQIIIALASDGDRQSCFNTTEAD